MGVVAAAGSAGERSEAARLRLGVPRAVGASHPLCPPVGLGEEGTRTAMFPLNVEPEGSAGLPSRRDHASNSPALSHANTRLPSAANAILASGVRWPFRSAYSGDRNASQMRMVPSFPPLTSRVPSGERASPRTFDPG